MKKQILNKVSAALIAVAMMTPGLSALQNTLLADILGGTDSTKTAFAQYGPSIPAPSVISNTATVSSGTLDTNTVNNSATAEDNFCFAPDIAVTSFTDTVTTIQAASTTSYSGVITNNGVSRVTEIQYTFAINTNFLNDTSISFATTVGSTSSVSTATVGSVKTYTYKITGIDLQPTQTVTVNVTGLTVAPTAVDGTIYATNFAITPTAPTFSGNCAITDPNTANNSATDDTTMVRVADLSIVKTSTGGADSSTSTKGRLNAGQSMSYTITTTNNGPSAAAANIVVVDTWPSQITPTAVSAGQYTSSANWSCTFASPTMTCTNTNPLANGATSAIVISGVVNQTY